MSSVGSQIGDGKGLSNFEEAAVRSPEGRQEVAVRERRPLSTRMLPLYIREQTPPARSPTANLDLEFGIHIEVAFGRLQA